MRACNGSYKSTVKIFVIRLSDQPLIMNAMQEIVAGTVVTGTATHEIMPAEALQKPCDSVRAPPESQANNSKSWGAAATLNSFTLGCVQLSRVLPLLSFALQNTAAQRRIWRTGMLPASTLGFGFCSPREQRRVLQWRCSSGCPSSFSPVPNQSKFRECFNVLFVDSRYRFEVGVAGTCVAWMPWRVFAYAVLCGLPPETDLSFALVSNCFAIFCLGMRFR